MDITLLWKQIKYGVEQWTWRLGRVRLTDEETMADSQTDDGVSTLNFVRRKAGEAVGVLRTAIRGRLSDNCISTGDKTDALELSKDGWTVGLKADGRFVCDAEDLAELMHAFVVDFVVFEWAKIYYPNDAPAFEASMRERLALVVDDVWKMGAPTRRRSGGEMCEML